MSMGHFERAEKAIAVLRKLKDDPAAEAAAIALAEIIAAMRDIETRTRVIEQGGGNQLF